MARDVTSGLKGRQLSKSREDTRSMSEKSVAAGEQKGSFLAGIRGRKEKGWVVRIGSRQTGGRKKR